MMATASFGLRSAISPTFCTDWAWTWPCTWAMSIIAEARLGMTALLLAARWRGTPAARGCGMGRQRQSGGDRDTGRTDHQAAGAGRCAGGRRASGRGACGRRCEQAADEWPHAEHQRQNAEQRHHAELDPVHHVVFGELR